MPVHIIRWSWEEAFDKFGFDDGDGANFTHEVADVLQQAGYTVECDTWGMHNYMIMKILDKDGECMVGSNDGSDEWKDSEGSSISLGYDDPRDYLPAELIKLLDEKLP